jgi:crotonobetainyl-CoA:carnitine CoA-transferase CaiB-like acyl-CoA transferase
VDGRRTLPPGATGSAGPAADHRASTFRHLVRPLPPPESAMNDSDDVRPDTSLLADVRVVDLTDAYGAFASRLLGELGAEVVRVEAPDGGGGRRRLPRAADGTSLHHAFRNAGKVTVTVDAATDDGGRTLDGLLAGADIAVMAQGGPAALAGLDASAISERHPHLVVASVTPFGLEGPAAGWRATELVAQAMAGVVYRSGVPELPPVSAPGSYCEDVGAATAAMAALLAMWHVRQGGAGQVLDVSSILALAACTEMSMPLWSLLGLHQVRSGAGAYPLFECTDGMARLVLPMTPQDWRSLIAWLGNPPEWTGPEWEGAMLDAPQREAIVERLPAMFASRTRAEVEAEGDAAGLRITGVLTPAEVLANEHVAARGTFVERPVGPSQAPGKVMAGVFGVDGRRAVVSPAAAATEAPTWPARPAPADGTAGPDRPLPLTGLRVLEVGSGVAAPEASRILGDWGADVLKIETTTRADFQRRVMGSDMNPAFSTVARNKRALAVDLGTEEGRELVRRLLPQVDVIVENNATGVIDRLGLGWDVVREINPRLVMVGTQLYGDAGPWASRKGYGPSARAVAGLTWLWAHGPDAPRGVMTIHPDHLAGRLVALAALAGLLSRERTGRGVHLSIAQFETVAALLGDLLLAESLEPGAAVPVGNRSPLHAPWGVYRAADEEDGSESWFALSVPDDTTWTALLSCAPASLDRSEWRTQAGRLADGSALDAAVSEWLRTEDGAALEEKLQSAGVPAGRALHARLQAEHPHFVARGYPVRIDQPGSGSLLVEGSAFTAPAFAPPRRGPAPAIAEHTAEICRELLGMDDAELDRLVAAGTVEVLAPPAG